MKKQLHMADLAELILSLPKTIWFNYKVLPLKDAIRLPFVVSYHVKIQGINRKNFIVETPHLPPFSQRIGIGGSQNGRRESPKGLLLITGKGRIILKGTVGLSRGCMLLAHEGDIVLGDHFRCNFSTTIDETRDPIVVGQNVACGWNVTIRNGDGHTIRENGVPRPLTAPVTIGDHVWLCADCTVLKGTTIGSESVVALGTLVAKANGEPGVLYAGVPAKIIKQNITWEE